MSLPVAWVVALAVLWESSALYLVVPLASRLTHQLGLTHQTLTLVQAAHVVGTLAASLLTPMLTIRLDARRVFVSGLLLFALALALWPVATTAVALIAFRFCSGTAGGIVWISGVAWLNEIQNPDDLGRNSGVVMATTLLGSATGPLLGVVALRTGLAPVTSCVAAASLGLAVVAGRRTPGRPDAVPVARKATTIAEWLGFAVVTTPLLVTCLAAGARFSLLPQDLSLAGMSASAVGLTFGAAGLAMAAIAVPVGHAVDRYGERMVLTLSLAAITVAAATLAAPISLGVMVVAGVVLSASLQVAWTPLLAMASRETSRRDLSHVGGVAILSTVWTVGILGGTALLAAADRSTSTLWAGVSAVCLGMLLGLPCLPIGSSKRRGLRTRVR